MSTPEEWFKSLPPITKAYFCIAVGTTVGVTFNILQPQHLYLDFDLIFRKFHIWRLLTSFCFFGKFSFPFLIQIVMLVRYFRKAETDIFPGIRGRADMLWCLLFGWFFMLVLAYVWEELFFLGPSLVFMMVYVWSRKDPHATTMFYDFAFKQWQIPYVLLLFAMLMGSSPILDLVGILIGHLYHFMIDIVPRRYGKTVFWVPVWFYDWVDRQASGAAAPGAAFRGAGYRLD